MAIEAELLPGPRAPPHRAGRQGAGVLARHQDRADPPPGRHADPAGPGVPGLRRPARGVATAGASGPGRAADRAARRDGRRYGHQRPPGVRVPDLCPIVIVDRSDRPRDPNHFHAQASLDAAIAAHGAIRTIALSLWKIASDIRLMGMGPRAGIGRARLARDTAGVQHHARQGEPGHRREPDDGRGTRHRQRCDRGVRPDRQLPRAQRHAAGHGGRRSSSPSRSWRPRAANFSARCIEG